MRPWIIGLSLLLFVLLGTGCTAQPSVNDLHNTPPPVSATTLFADDFSDASSGWGVWDQKDAVVAYHNGGLHILVQVPQYDFWSVSGHEFGDVKVEADAVKIGGPDDNDFGLICRYADKDNFYALMISNDGYYGVTRVKDGQYTMLGSDKLQYSPAILKGQGNNHLRADCVGSTLRLFANGQKLIEVQDATFSSGDAGLIAGAYDISGVDILFDNFVVSKP